MWVTPRKWIKDAMANTEECQVECYAGHRYAQEPRAFVCRGTRHLIEQIRDSWRSPQGWGFVVCTTDRRCFTLNYDEARDVWTVTADALG